MALFYQVMGQPKCPKIKNRLGLKIKPITKTKESYYSPGDLVIYECESNETRQTIKCLDDGRWNEIPPCPDPTNNTCPSLEPIRHGYFNATGPYKVNTVVAFRCENELINNNNNNTIITNSLRKPKDLKDDTSPNINQSLDGQRYTIPTTINTNLNEVDAIQTTLPTFKPQLARQTLPGAGSPSTSLPSQAPNSSTNLSSFNINQTIQQHSIIENSNSIRYNLTGHRILKCLPSSKWNFEQPICTPILPEQASNFSLFLTSAIIILIPILIFIGIIQIFLRWRKRQQQRERWKQYFTDYKYRHSKTSITFGMRPNQNSLSNTTIPVTDL